MTGTGRPSTPSNRSRRNPASRAGGDRVIADFPDPRFYGLQSVTGESRAPVRSYHPPPVAPYRRRCWRRRTTHPRDRVQTGATTRLPSSRTRLRASTESSPSRIRRTSSPSVMPKPLCCGRSTFPCPPTRARCPRSRRRPSGALAAYPPVGARASCPRRGRNALVLCTREPPRVGQASFTGIRSKHPYPHRRTARAAPPGASCRASRAISGQLWTRALYDNASAGRPFRSAML